MSEHLCLPVSKIINWPLDLFIGVPIFYIEWILDLELVGEYS